MVLVGISQGRDRIHREHCCSHPRVAPHLTPAELDLIHELAAGGKLPMDTHHAPVSKRAWAGVAAPTLRRFRDTLHGLAYKRSRRETRGRRPKLTRQNIMKMSSKRKQLIKKAQGQREVRWEDVRKASRVQRVHRSTLHRSFQKVGLGVKARSPRLKPGRTPTQAAARVSYCEAWCNKPPSMGRGVAGRWGG